MRSEFSFRKVAIAGLVALACIQPVAWTDNAVNTRVSPSPPVPNSQATSEPPFPIAALRQATTGTGGRNISVTEGLARLIAFESNVLAVFFSNENVINVEAVNSRMLAITGKARGASSLAIFLPRYAGDTIGKPSLFKVTVEKSPTAMGNDTVASVSKVVVPLNTDRISRILGRQWPSGDKSFEEMLVEEIQKRDSQIKELEKQLKEKTQ